MRKNVFLYTEKWCSGGIESFLVNIVENINKSKFNVSVLVSQKETEIYDKVLKDNKCELYRTLKKNYKNPIVRTLKNILNFKHELLKRKIDIIHINICNSVGFIYAYIAKKVGIQKIIIHAHNTGISNDSLKIKSLAHNICKAMIKSKNYNFLSCSDKATQFIFPKEIQNEVELINNGINVDKYKFNKKYRNEFREKINVKEEILIGHVGRFSKQKNHKFLIETFYELYKKNKNVKLILIGEGELKKDIVNFVKENKLQNQVIFYGTTNNVPMVLSALDIFVLPSLYEGNPVSGIEAQASGVSCVFSDTITKQVQLTKKVFFVELNKKKWCEQIEKINININQREDIAKEVKNAGFDIKETVKRLERIYENTNLKGSC